MAEVVSEGLLAGVAADDVAEAFGGDVEVAAGGVQQGVAEEGLEAACAGSRSSWPGCASPPADSSLLGLEAAVARLTRIIPSRSGPVNDPHSISLFVVRPDGQGGQVL